MTFAAELRNAVRDEHDAIERTRVSARLADGTITTAEYADLLRQLHTVHTALERAWRSRPELEDLYPFARHSRLAAVDADLATLGEPLDDGSEPHPSVDELLASIDRWAESSPVSLVGPMYVLEGSRMGSQGLAKSLPAILGTAEGEGVRYHASPEGWFDEWRTFKTGLEDLCTDPDDRAAVVAAAKQTFVALIGVYDGRSVDR